MNTNKKNLGIVVRAKKTFVGRIVCRLAGEENGQAMMEYVIIAVFIAAAVALAAWYFGRGIFDGFRKTDAAVRGDVQQAEAIHNQSNTDRPTQGAAADASNKQFINHPGENSATTGNL